MKVEKFKIKGWKGKERGLVISENEDWILVRHIPLDFIIDGFKLYSKKYIKSRKSKEKEQKIERVLLLKNVSITPPKGFEFGDAVSILKWLEKKYGLFEFQFDFENEILYGRINTISKNFLKIDFVDANGIIEEAFDYNFDLDQIRVITFETDYFNSIRLLMRNA